MLRGCLLQISSQEQILLLIMHHIASDGWSLDILTQQLSQVYTAFLNGQSNPLTPMAIQYADFALWQRQWLSGEEFDRQLQYWKQQLTGANTILELPTDYPRPPIQTYSGGGQSWVLGKNLTTALKNLCLQEKVTLYITLLAAFSILLSRHSGQDDILVGSPIAGRQKTEAEKMIGFFINTLVLRINLSENPTFQQRTLKDFSSRLSREILDEDRRHYLILNYYITQQTFESIETINESIIKDVMSKNLYNIKIEKKSIEN
jgi:hypothetical protein